MCRWRLLGMINPCMVVQICHHLEHAVKYGLVYLTLWLLTRILRTLTKYIYQLPTIIKSKAITFCNVIYQP